MKDEIIRDVYTTLIDRRDNPIDSYTSKMMQDSDKKSIDKILEKVGEESTELILAAKNDENLIGEATDVIFFTLMTLVKKGVELDELYDELIRRNKK